MTTSSTAVASILAVAAGSAAGGLLRWGAAQALHGATGSAFPWGTLTVNVLGCLAIGALAALVAREPQRLPDWVQLGLFVGLLGGFTTFSSFAREALMLVQSGRAGMAAAYVLASNTMGLGAAWVGWVAVR